MADTPNFEIPEAVRELAERNVEQARTAYEQFMFMAQQAQSMVPKPSGPMAESALDIQTRTMRYAKDNVDAGFRLAAELAKARDVTEYMQIQARYAERQMKTLTDQAQDLTRVMTDMAQKTQGR